MAHPSKPAQGRADKILPGIWRLRLPLPWDATPHGNAYLVTHGDKVVLFDTGFGGRDGFRHFEFALMQAGFGLDDIELIVCTHEHSDHYGAAASIVERTGAPLWIHPAYEHVRTYTEDVETALAKRTRYLLANGVPPDLAERARAARAEIEPGFDGLVAPDRELTDGIEIETDVGTWVTYEAPGHAPGHVVFHQPDRRFLISGDVIVGRVFLYFDCGHTPDPLGEFIGSLDVLEGLDVGLCLSGHGRPFRDVPGKLAANREAVAKHLGRVRDAMRAGKSTLFEIGLAASGRDELPDAAIGYIVELTDAFVTHLAVLGEAERDETDGDGAGEGATRWSIR